MKAADVKVEPYWPGLFAKALDGLNLKSMITNVGSGVGAAPAAGAAAAGNTSDCFVIRSVTSIWWKMDGSLNICMNLPWFLNSLQSEPSLDLSYMSKQMQCLIIVNFVAPAAAAPAAKEEKKEEKKKEESEEEDDDMGFGMVLLWISYFQHHSNYFCIAGLFD